MAHDGNLSRFARFAARKLGDFVRAAEKTLGLDYDRFVQNWQGEPLDWMKKVDGHGQWVAKSGTEKARLVLGHFGEDSRTQNDYPGIQVEKDGVVGEVRWGPEQRTAQDAHIHAEKMLDVHLGFPAPMLQPSSMLDIRKSDEMSEHLGADVRPKSWKKYAKQCAKTLTSAAAKYGSPGDSQQREITPPSRSR